MERIHSYLDLSPILVLKSHVLNDWGQYLWTETYTLESVQYTTPRYSGLGGGALWVLPKPKKSHFAFKTRHRRMPCFKAEAHSQRPPWNRLKSTLLEEERARFGGFPATAMAAKFCYAATNSMTQLQWQGGVLPVDLLDGTSPSIQLGTSQRQRCRLPALVSGHSNLRLLH